MASRKGRSLELAANVFGIDSASQASGPPRTWQPSPRRASVELLWDSSFPRPGEAYSPNGKQELLRRKLAERSMFLLPMLRPVSVRRVASPLSYRGTAPARNFPYVQNRAAKREGGKREMTAHRSRCFLQTVAQLRVPEREGELPASVRLDRSRQKLMPMHPAFVGR